MTEQILLYAVSIATILLLIYTTVAIVLLVQIFKRVKKIAERTQEEVETVADMVSEVKEYYLNPMKIASIVGELITKSSKRRRK